MKEWNRDWQGTWHVTGEGENPSIARCGIWPVGGRWRGEGDPPASEARCPVCVPGPNE